jgi:hypothetical protein
VSETEGLKKECDTELKELEQQRQPWDSRCRGVTDYIFPYGGRYADHETNDGVDRTRLIIDSTGTRCKQILSAGMLSFGTSRARPWFALTLRDKRLAKRYAVKVWLSEATQIIQDALGASNTYTALRKSYDELGAFGTSCTIIEPDFNDVVWFHPVTNGRFYLADNYRGEVDTCYRKMTMTTRQLGDTFGTANLPDNIRQDYDARRNLHQQHPVVHAIKPRLNRNRRSKRNKDKAWASLWYLPHDKDGKMLRESGYDFFPVLAPRWDTTGGDVYGNGPGFDSLRMIQQLQQEQFRKAKAIDQMTDPAKQGPSSLKEKDLQDQPGMFTAVDMASPNAKVQNLVDIRIDLSHLLLDINDVRQQIRECWFTDLFQTHIGAGDERKTAEEIKAKTEEKMVLLGPVTSNLDREQNSPLIRIVFEQLWRGGALPPVPDELEGQAIEIEYVSVLAQAQKAIGANTMDRFTSFVGMVGAVQPQAWDCFNVDTSIERMADKLSIDPDLIVPGPQRALIRQARAQQQAAEKNTLLMAEAAKGMQAMGNTPVGGSQPTALDAMARLTGVGGAG